jgi:hypothetical protein
MTTERQRKNNCATCGKDLRLSARITETGPKPRNWCDNDECAVGRKPKQAKEVE